MVEHGRSEGGKPHYLREHRCALTPATLELVFPLVPGCGSYLAFSPHARGVRAGVGQALGWGGTREETREGDGVDERNDLISSLTHSISFRSNHHLLTPFLCLLGQASALCRLAHLVCAYFSTLHRVVVSVSCRPGSVNNLRYSREKCKEEQKAREAV